jgi:putative SOS response-associated peptidase YedK
MCGRYELNATPAELHAQFAALLPAAAWEAAAGFASYNVAPSLRCPVIRYSKREQTNVVDLLTWGFQPQWSKRSFINARDDRLFAAPTFREAARKRRCLVIATGWYEWQAQARAKQPFYAHLRKQTVMAFAGIWTARKDARDEWSLSFAIVTTEATPAISEIHDRMPLVLSAASYAAWLDPATADPQALLAPLPDAELTAHPVSRFVNDPKNDGPECIAAIGSQ